jgi:hypothetical protein
MPSRTARLRSVPVVLALAVAAALGGLPSGEARAETVARPGTATAVREYDGTIVFSAYDAAARAWFLEVREAGGRPRRLPVPASPTPFGADIGTDSNGRPQLIYERCTGFEERRSDTFVFRAPTGCDLFVLSLAGGGERPVRNANDPENDDVGATLWRGRIAWTRLYDSGPVVYTKTLTAPRSRPSTRLPGVPERRCGPSGASCATTRDRNVGELELWGRHLAVNVTYTCRPCSGVAQGELRLDDVNERTSRTIARQIIGLNGQKYVGASFADGQLGWYRACAVSERSCRSIVGPFRFRLSDATYRRAGGPILVADFADAGERLYEVLDCESPEAAALGAVSPACRIDEITAPAYSPASPPIERDL